MTTREGRALTLPLFEDSRFEPVFGLPYSLTTAEERAAVWRLSRWLCPGRTGLARYSGGAFDDAFHNERDFNEIVAALVDREELAAWHETAMGEIGGLADDGASLPRLAAIEAEAKSRAKEIPADAQAALAGALKDKRAAIAVVEINKRVAAVPALPAEMRSLDVLKTLIADARAVRLPAADASALSRSVRAKADAIAGPAIAAALAEAERAPATLDGLAELTRLDREMGQLAETLGPELGMTEAVGRVRAIGARRATLIADPAIQLAFAEALGRLEPRGGDPAGQVAGAAGRYIDRRHYDGPNAIPAYARAVQRAIAVMEIRAIDFADRSGSAMEGEPTAEEMLFAVKAKFDQINDELSSTFGRCQRREFQNDPLMAMQCLTIIAAGGGGEFKVRMTRFEKLGCALGLNRSGFICDYVLGFELNSPFMQGRMGELMGAGSVSQGRFLKLAGGWVFTRLR